MLRGEQCQEVSNGNLDLGRKLLDACKNGETEEVRELMANGAPFTTDWLGTSPLHFAAQYGHTDTAEFLLRSGVSRDTRTKVERTPLHVSAQEGHLQIVSLLLTYGADIDARDLLKMTPLHWAVERGHYDVVECLLANGADVNLLSKFDKTPIDIARDSGRLDMIPLLEKYVNVSRPRQDNRTTNNNNNSCFPQKTRPTVLPNKSNRTAKIVKPIGSVNTNSTVKGTSTTSTTSSSSSCPTFSSTVIANLSKTNVDALKKLLNGTDIHLEVGSNHVLTTLAALAEATGQTTDNLTNNNSQLTAEALQWLDTHGATSALEKSMLTSSIESGGSNLIKLSSTKPDIELTSETFDSSGLADYDGSKVKVNFIDGSSERFHVAWLRDSCQCSQCVSPLTKDKKINPADIDFQQLRPIKMSNDGVNLKIEWIDGLSSSHHLSTYSLSMLQMFKGKFDGQSDPADGVYGPEKIIQPIPWDVETIKPICEVRFDYDRLMTDETTLMNVLEGILHYGIVFIADAPTEKETVLNIARRIAYERTTGYGTTFDLVANSDPNAHFSYSSAPLELHTDLCYRERVPGIQLLHCIQSAVEGGQSSFADGLYCGQQLQQNEPELFDILTTPVTFSFYDSQRGIWFRQKWPVIVTDEPNAKTIKEVNLSYFSMRAPLLPDDQMGTFFTAFRKFYNYTRSPSNRLSLKLREGEVAIFNNRRIVHGREGYSQNEKRFLQGCYMDLDEIQGLYEKLSTKSNQH